MSSDIRQTAPHDFPPLLGEIPDPPEKLYVRGNLPSFEYKWLTVVGSRKYSSYGKQVCEHLIQGLRGYPIVIVSGLALGIDSIAHKAALDVGLPTIAVPGSGLDSSVLYPRSNRALAEAIVRAGGALFSEFEPTFKATPWSFPQRNRVMAGVSHATLLIEAQEKSGTLITAKLASDYNRDVLVVPHAIFNESGKGVHQFLKLGATPVTSAEDILNALGIMQEKRIQLNHENLSENERVVVKVLATPCERDEVIRELALPTHEANILLSTMELKGLIAEELGVMRVRSS